MAQIVKDGGVETPPRLFADICSDKHSPHQVDEALEHIRINLARYLPEVPIGNPREKPLLIVGSGPSLADTLDVLRNTEGDILAINEAHDWLLDNGVRPNYYGQMEISPWPKDVLTKPQQDCVYLLPSMSAPENFDRLEGYHVAVWHAWTGIGEEKLLPGKMIVSGSGVFSVRAISLGMLMGYRKFEMFGCDGSFREKTHVDRDRDVARSDALDVEYLGKKYKSAHYLMKGVYDLQRYCGNFNHWFSLKCHGEGLMQTMHRDCFPQQYA
jgi:hypothetical protein